MDRGLDFPSTLPPLRRAKSLDRRTTESVMTVSALLSSVLTCEFTLNDIIYLFIFSQERRKSFLYVAEYTASRIYMLLFRMMYTNNCQFPQQETSHSE